MFHGISGCVALDIFCKLNINMGISFRSICEVYMVDLYNVCVSSVLLFISNNLENCNAFVKFCRQKRIYMVARNTK